MTTLFHPNYIDKHTGEKKLLKKWYAKVRFADGVTRKVPFSANKSASEIQLGKLLEKIEREKLGITDPTEQHRLRPLAEHLSDWHATLKTRDASKKHVRQRYQYAWRVILEMKAVFAKDITESAIRQALVSIRGASGSIPALDPAKETCTKSELARLLGVEPVSVAALVQRHRLPATGNGSSRRFPKTTVETLLSKRSRGMSARTMNEYLSAVKQFFAWMVRDKRIWRSAEFDLPVGRTSSPSEVLRTD